MDVISGCFQETAARSLRGDLVEVRLSSRWHLITDKFAFSEVSDACDGIVGSITDFGHILRR